MYLQFDQIMLKNADFIANWQIYKRTPKNSGKVTKFCQKSEKLTNKNLQEIKIIQLLVSLIFDSYIFVL